MLLRSVHFMRPMCDGAQNVRSIGPMIIACRAEALSLNPGTRIAPGLEALDGALEFSGQRSVSANNL